MIIAMLISTHQRLVESCPYEEAGKRNTEMKKSGCRRPVLTHLDV